MSATAIDPTTQQNDDYTEQPDGQLKAVDVPRVGILVDETDPTVIRVTFSGKVDLERGTKSDVEFFNQLRAGKPFELTIAGHVAGAKTTHRRDSEGDVDAVVQSKSLVVDSVTGLEQ
jgi:hypothetical protein